MSTNLNITLNINGQQVEVVDEDTARHRDELLQDLTGIREQVALAYALNLGSEDVADDAPLPELIAGIINAAQRANRAVGAMTDEVRQRDEAVATIAGRRRQAEQDLQSVRRDLANLAQEYGTEPGEAFLPAVKAVRQQNNAAARILHDAGFPAGEGLSAQALAITTQYKLQIEAVQESLVLVRDLVDAPGSLPAKVAALVDRLQVAERLVQMSDPEARP